MGVAATGSTAAFLRRGAGRGLIVGAVLAAGALLPQAAFAQFNSFGGAPTGPVVGSSNQNQQGPKPAAPPALPGSRVEKTEPAPAAPGAADLPPTEALFDAINRGDMLSARDAINRGADLNGHNVLGLSPLDLSVDLGRNEITFLLLSLRTPDTGSGPPGAVASAATAGGKRGAKAKPGAQTASAGAAAPSLWPNSAPATAPGASTAAAASAGADGSPAAADGLTPAQRRAQERAAAREAQRQAVADAQARKAQERADRLAAAAARAGAPGTGGERQVVSTTAQAPAPQPRQYAGQRDESGTPIPQMGFLGFGTVTR
jgi:hypothetical protein